MLRRGQILALLLLFCVAAWGRNERDTIGVGVEVGFVPNLGQWSGDYAFEAQMHGAALFAADGSVTIALREHSEHPQPYSPELPRCHAYRMTFEGCRSSAPRGIGAQESYNNYMLGGDPSMWRSKVPVYESLHYAGIYDGIDLDILGADRALKYNFTVHPGADPAAIVIVYEGNDGVSVERGGSLRVRTTVRDVVELKPYVYQSTADGGRVEVKSEWRVTRGKDGLYRAGIVVGDYDTGRDLVVDPVLFFSTYTGSTADNWGTTAAYDSKKHVYTAGMVFSIGYPTSLGAYQTSSGGGVDVGIFKFDSSGQVRMYATYLGGNRTDMPHSMVVNSFDELLVFGTTGSGNFPVTTGAFQQTFGGGQSVNYMSSSIGFPNGSDIFVCSFSTDGTELKASTLVCGSGNDGLNFRNYFNYNTTVLYGGNDSLYYNYSDGARGSIITDNLNNVYVGSTTFSSDFPTTEGSVQPSSGGRQDGVVFKLDYNLRNLLWSTYLGGSMDDAVYNVDVDSAYNLLVCGGTSSTDFPVTDGTFQTEYGGGPTDGFISKISYGGERLMASTFVGDRFSDQIYFVRSGRHDEVFVFGHSLNSGSNMIYNAAYSVYNSGMLIAHFDPWLKTRRWSTVIGTPGRINLSPTAFGVDICNRVYGAGWGREFAGPGGVAWNSRGTQGMEITADAYQDTTDGQDFYIFSLGMDASSLEHATFFGELHNSSSSYSGRDHVDGGTSCFDRMATIYQSVCASCSGNQGFPVTDGVWSTTNKAENCNNAIFRYNVRDDFPVADFTLPQSGCVPYTLELQNTGRGTEFLWDFGDGSTSTEHSPTHTYTVAGTYTITLISQMPGGCAAADTQTHVVQVLDNLNLSHMPEIACNGIPIQIGVKPSLGASYQWSGDEVSDASVANPWVSTTGTYVLSTTADGCVQTDTFHVMAYRIIDTVRVRAISCHDSIDGGATVVIGNGVEHEEMQLDVTPQCPVGQPYEQNGRWMVDIDSMAPGVEYHIVAEAHGCTAEKVLTLPNPPVPPYEKDFSKALCTDSCLGYIHLNYMVGDGMGMPMWKDTMIDGLCDGLYITPFTIGGCPVVDTSLIVRDHTVDSLRAWVERDHIILGESVRLHTSGVEGTAIYNWLPGHTVDNPGASDPLATPDDTLVCYTVTAVSELGCEASARTCVECTAIVCGEPELALPNAFTPDGDGINDMVCFNSDLITDFSIAIFNRWGQCVFSSDALGTCWDGTFNGRPCLQGVYTYTCHIRCVSGQENDLKGDITLIR